MRCKTGPVYNNGRELRISDLIYGRPYQIKDNFGRDWPGGCACLFVVCQRCSHQLQLQLQGTCHAMIMLPASCNMRMFKPPVPQTVFVCRHHLRLHVGNPRETEDVVFAQCWDDTKSITVRVADSCPCKYNIKETGEVRTQNWCCGGNNHFDL